MTGRLPLRPCWFLSGNNVSPAKDAHRRWLPCNLRTDLERPQERGDFAVRDLRGHIREHRAEIVSHALTIIKAHVLAGRPTGSWPPLGSFESWDTAIRGAVWFALESDCCTTQRAATDEAPERLDKLALLEGWRELAGGGDEGAGWTVQDALHEVAESPSRYPILRAALMRLSRDDRLPTPRVIGNRIRAMRAENVGGLMFQRAGESHRSIRWKAIKV